MSIIVCLARSLLTSFPCMRERSSILKFDNYIPGPGAYTLFKKENNLNNINNTYSQITDKEIIDKLDAVGSMQGYIKQLIRQDMTLSPYLRMLVLKDAEGYELMDVFRENGLRKARLIKGDKIVHVIEKEDGNITVEEGGA